jgi:hypothetical protein
MKNLNVISKYTQLCALCAITSYIVCSCTLSYQNICTHGTTDGVGDEQLSTDPVVSTTATATLNIPKVPLPYMNGPAAPALLGPK